MAAFKVVNGKVYENGKAISAQRVVDKLNSSEFEVGALIALGMIAGWQDRPTIAANVVREMGLENADVSHIGFSEFDLKGLSKLNDEDLNIRY